MPERERDRVDVIHLLREGEAAKGRLENIYICMYIDIFKDVDKASEHKKWRKEQGCIFERNIPLHIHGVSPLNTLGNSTVAQRCAGRYVYCACPFGRGAASGVTLVVY